MSREIGDFTHRDASDDLVDEELRALAHPAAVDLRGRVLAAIDGSGVPQPERWFTLPRLALGSAAVVLLMAAVVTWRPWSGVGQDVRLKPDAGSHVRLMPDATDKGLRPDVTYERDARADLRQSAASAPVASGSSSARVASGFSRTSGLRPSLVAARTVAASAQILMSDDDDVPVSPLPGAPAGELGDPLEPLPMRPVIAFAPIESAPPVSELSRPVTDFPADNPVPAGPTGPTGRTGGTRR
jgi:hypothetical protein